MREEEIKWGVSYERKKKLIGVVVSDKADKTITVKVETYKKHPLYGKKLNIQRNMLLTMKIIWHMLEIKVRLAQLDHYLKQRDMN